VTENPADLLAPAYRHVADLDDPATVALAAGCRARLAADGVAVLPGFLHADVVTTVSEQVVRLAPGEHRQDVSGSPYLDLPDESQPAGHPRRASGRSALTAVGYDRFPADSPLRRVYEWDGLLDFLGAALDRRPLHRYDDDLGALNVAVMYDGDELFWHFDQTDFVVSIALQASEGGGDFECAGRIRTAEAECYDAVARVLAGDARTTTITMDPGSLVLFEGRHSLHRVTPVRGSTPRLVALLAYDTRPGTCSSELLRLVRYGRARAEPTPA
jgi:hypothetical protein